MKKISKFDVNSHIVHGMTMRTPSYNAYEVLFGFDDTTDVMVIDRNIYVTANFKVYLCFEI